ncbi:unnamed protein product [Gongylonema pulchrum]|uniref:Secreted protein n=1 Tax=Gongylonema pulchrum TaxID=637853 RepID=A0A183DPJ2_9BILA|nr:unnamed protein product [Gongylonema pulchrum]
MSAAVLCSSLVYKARVQAEIDVEAGVEADDDASVDASALRQACRGCCVEAAVSKLLCRKLRRIYCGQPTRTLRKESNKFVGKKVW